MFSWWNLFNFLLVFFLSYQVWKVAAFDQDCQPDDSRKCMLMNSLRAAYDKRVESVAQQAVDGNQQLDGGGGGDDEQAALQQQLNSANNDRLGDLLDLNSEPAVEDLMRQIMSQAKLWEAIQEANREMIIQKTNKAKARERFPLAFSAQ
ncbi:uncharacterized protein LOC129577074 [Sitodiplosis mosellana]|uniref:uncharacterized protein LOC129577074 n=1 Tax=Sitodiplosis mosellana TaxID=263140 RepID=UPI002443C6D9|nr:uncharacterized protein LOC129577074 [Sitodiplosis mosellana]